MAENGKITELTSEMLEKITGGYYNTAALEREIAQKRAAGMTLEEFLRYVRGGIGSMNEYEWLEMQDFIRACWGEGDEDEWE